MRTVTSVALWLTLTILAALFSIWLGYSDALTSEGRGLLFVGIMCLSVGLLVGRKLGLREARQEDGDRQEQRRRQQQMHRLPQQLQVFAHPARTTVKH